MNQSAKITMKLRACERFTFNMVAKYIPVILEQTSYIETTPLDLDGVSCKMSVYCYVINARINTVFFLVKCYRSHENEMKKCPECPNFANKFR